MSNVKAKMHQIRFLLGLRPRPRWGAYGAPSDPIAVFKGPTSKGREGGEEEGGVKRKVSARERRGCGGRYLAHTKILAWRPYGCVTVI